MAIADDYSRIGSIRFCSCATIVVHALTASAYSSPNLIGILVYPPGTGVVTVTDQWDDDDKRRRQQQHLTANGATFGPSILVSII
ncbi:hypothetical protein BLOT_005118 [Blomia tropicalis]|nr:hypothetical protein BLOT_005118 [Blomia tropicalis]